MEPLLAGHDGAAVDPAPDDEVVEDALVTRVVELLLLPLPPAAELELVAEAELELMALLEELVRDDADETETDEEELTVLADDVAVLADATAVAV